MVLFYGIETGGYFFRFPFAFVTITMWETVYTDRCCLSAKGIIKMSGALCKMLQRTWSSEVSLDFKEENPTQITSANVFRQVMVYLSESKEEVHLFLGKQGCSRGLRSSHL